MSQGSDELPLDGLEAALVNFTGCVGTALDDICSYGLTVGDAYVPFDPDEEDECGEGEAECSQVWVRVMGSGITNLLPSWSGDCGGTMQLQLEVGVIRCIEIEEGGEAPTATTVLGAALQAMEDMNALYCAAMNCEVWESIEAGEWQPIGPFGGQYGGIWTFVVESDGRAITPTDPVEPGRACGMWTGDGPPPDDILGAEDGDEYVDLLTGDVYELGV